MSPERAYRKIASTPSYFYKYSIPKLASNKEARVPDIIEARRKLFTTIENAMIEKNSLREDIEQLFILHILQSSRHSSVKDLRMAFKLQVYSILSITVFFLGSIFLAELIF